MSIFREYIPIEEHERFNFDDRQVIKKLLNTKKLTDREKLAIKKLLITYDHATD